MNEAPAFMTHCSINDWEGPIFVILVLAVAAAGASGAIQLLPSHNCHDEMLVESSCAVPTVMDFLVSGWPDLKLEGI